MKSYKIIILVVLIAIVLYLFLGKEMYTGPPTAELADPKGICKKAERMCRDGFFPGCMKKGSPDLTTSAPNAKLSDIKWVTYDTNHLIDGDTPSCWNNCDNASDSGLCFAPDGTWDKSSGMGNIHDWCTFKDKKSFPPDKTGLCGSGGDKKGGDKKGGGNNKGRGDKGGDKKGGGNKGRGGNN